MNSAVADMTEMRVGVTFPPEIVNMLKDALKECQEVDAYTLGMHILTGSQENLHLARECNRRASRALFESH